MYYYNVTFKRGCVGICYFKRNFLELCFLRVIYFYKEMTIHTKYKIKGQT